MADKRYMEFIRARVTQTSINTFLEVQLRLPTSESELMAVLIHQIAAEIPNVDRIDATIVNTDVSVGLRAGTNRTINFPGALYNRFLQIDAGSVQGTLSEYYQQIVLGDPRVKYFNPPVLVAQNVLYAKIQSLGMPTVNYVDVAIGYTLEKVSREAFIAALVSYL